VDAAVAEVAVGADYAGEPDPYKAPRDAEEPESAPGDPGSSRRPAVDQAWEDGLA
jgi:hypothetical protein